MNIRYYALFSIKKAINAIRTLLRKTGDAIALLPRLTRKPLVLRRWLLSAHWAHIVLVLVIITMPRLIPSAIDIPLKKLYPPITEINLGLIHHTKHNPHFKVLHNLVRMVLWTGSGSCVLCLLLLHIPAAIDKAHAIARKYEKEADALADSKPSQSLVHYKSAISLAFDPTYEARLKSKCKALIARFGKVSEQGSNVSLKPKNPPEAGQTRKQKIDAEPALDAGGDSANQTVRIEDLDDIGVGPDGRYLIWEELGRGAMGIVSRAHDRVLARDVAFKQIPEYLSHDQRLVARFRQEARALARLCHPNIVQVYDFVQDGEQAWMVMELVEGEELEKSLRKCEIVSIEETVSIGIQLAEAMDYAHERGVIHRDFKPSNVLLTEQGSVKITDFGLAKLTQSNIHTIEGAILGSPAYMSPEQANGRESDARTDIYALGVMLFKMLTGHFPFEGNAESIIAQKLIKDPPPLSAFNKHVPEHLNRLVGQMLAKEPDKRPAGMHQVAEDLCPLWPRNN
ncbi:MAG: serine/threonine-protein kinase [bacterium]